MVQVGVGVVYEWPSPASGQVFPIGFNLRADWSAPCMGSVSKAKSRGSRTSVNSMAVMASRNAWKALADPWMGL
jgi:hypothetical protein